MLDLTSLSWEQVRHLLSSPFLLLVAAFQIWMLVHAIREREWTWVVFMLIFPGFTSIWYFFMVYRSSSGGMRGFELPGAVDRRRIQELQAQIHHLDKPHHHLQLGDIYFQHGQLDKAEASYRAALERDPQDIDTRAHLGQCLLRRKRPAEARPLLESACQENPKHDYGHSLMALAETLAALGDTDAAIAVWEQVTAGYSYSRARVQLAELYLAQQQPEKAREQLQEVLTDAPHGPAFERKRERVWVRRARKLMGRIRA
ncbi:MAG: tetratricopeptide repeat protein [Verrucomicrobia bacterium]|nr:tetratricopeptide repeat protein [Verrucomicrobiota bacterium]